MQMSQCALSPSAPGQCLGQTPLRPLSIGNLSKEKKKLYNPADIVSAKIANQWNVKPLKKTFPQMQSLNMSLNLRTNGLLKIQMWHPSRANRLLLCNSNIHLFLGKWNSFPLQSSDNTLERLLEGLMTFILCWNESSDWVNLCFRVKLIGGCQLNKESEGHCPKLSHGITSGWTPPWLILYLQSLGVSVCMCVCMLTNIGGGLPVASQLMTRSSTLKTVTDPGCVVIIGGLFTAKDQRQRLISM